MLNGEVYIPNDDADFVLNGEVIVCCMVNCGWCPMMNCLCPMVCVQVLVPNGLRARYYISKCLVPALQRVSHRCRVLYVTCDGCKRVWYGEL